MKEITKKGNLVRLLDLDQEFIIDLKYATEDNFTKSKVYDSPECYIDENTAVNLIRAKNILKSKGFGVKIWDAYRPVSAQQKFWDLVPNTTFVARPPDMKTFTDFRNSHMNGQCVDVSLVSLNGEEIPMPSKFDDFSPRARLDFEGTQGEARKNAEILRDSMVEAGFEPYDGEWWHFYDRNTSPVKYSDIKF